MTQQSFENNCALRLFLVLLPTYLRIIISFYIRLKNIIFCLPPPLIILLKNYNNRKTNVTNITI